MEIVLTNIAGYALKMAITLSLLYIPYIYLLRGETHLRTARATLLATLLLSIALPFIEIPGLHMELPYQIHMQIEAKASTGELLSTGDAYTAGNPFSLQTLSYYTLIIPYIIITIAIALIRIVQIVKIRTNIGKGALWMDKKDKYTIHCHANPIPAYSWMRHIAISQEDYERYGNEIILHEEGHITNRHSWDMLLLTLVETLQWFNPFVHMLANDLKDTHEYEADEYVIKRNYDIRAYQMTIIKKAVDRASYTLVNSFNHSNNLKKRITMMLKKKSNPWRRTTALYILPAAAIALSLFASPQQATGTESSQSTIVATTDKVSKSVEKNDTIANENVRDENVRMPEFPGGIKAMMTFINQNISYPDEAKKQNKQGKAVVNFIVDTDGSICEVEILRSAGNEHLDKEAIRVVSSMPKWIPATKDGKAVRTQFALPISFKLK